MHRLLALAVAGLVAASGSAAHAQSTGPGVAIGKVTQGWNHVTVDYGVGDPASVELRVLLPGGRTVVVDSSGALQGTLEWDRKIDHHHVPPGPYRLQVVATDADGTSRTTVRVRLGLLYLSGPARTQRNRVVLRYTLAEAARVLLYVIGPDGNARLAEKRHGLRGHNHITWDFRINGRRVPAGRYALRLAAA